MSGKRKKAAPAIERPPLDPRIADVLAGRARYAMMLGDCLDPVTGLASLPDGAVDVVIADPPYEEEAHTDQRRQKGKTTRPGANDMYRGVSEAALDFDAITAEERAELAAQIARVARHRSAVFCQAEAVDAWKRAFNDGGMPYRRAIPWIKPDAMPSLHGRYPGQSYESIVLAQHASASAAPIGGKAVVYQFTRARAGQAGGPGGTEAPHPTTKPLQLMLAMITDLTEPGDVVCDPTAGSGTTIVAALMLGRRAIGWERREDYHAIACRRIAGDEAKPRPEQPSLFTARTA